MSAARKKDPLIFVLLSTVCIVTFLTAIVAGAWIAAGGIRLYRIPTNSMSPTISTEDKLVVERLTYCFSQPKRGDIVTFSTEELPVPYDKKELFCQRIIGVPGDLLEVKFGRIHVNGCPLSECKPPVAPVDRINPGAYAEYLSENGSQFLVPEEKYFLIGDNLTNSLDSRYLGPSSRKSILGKVAFIMHPGH
jgi:signal peptidase I